MRGHRTAALSEPVVSSDRCSLVYLHHQIFILQYTPHSMSLQLLSSNLLSPPILFFLLGLLAVRIRSDLEVPEPVSKLFSLYLLLAIGFRGGVELHASNTNAAALTTIGAGLALAILVPGYAFLLFRRRVGVDDAAALSASYGSVSAVTFIAATAFLTQQGQVPGGHLVATMALMEAPAIAVGLLLARLAGGRQSHPPGTMLKEVFANGSVLLLLGSLLIGFVTGEGGEKALEPFVNDLFKGFLCLFLLDMGIAAGRRWSAVRTAGAGLMLLGIVIPLLNATLALALSKLLGLGQIDTVMLMTLAASASYIAVPAAMRLALPHANAGLYLALPLAVTFPFNVVLGLPLYLTVARSVTP